MYFDPTLRTDAKPIETKANPLKLGTLIAWLEKQPAGKRYCYTSAGHCLLANYFEAQGFSRIVVAPFAISHAGGSVRISRAFGMVALNSPHTYGAALDRARAL